MRKKIIWVVITCLIASAMILASCGEEVTQEEGKTIVVKVVEKEVTEEK